ncbi:uncharacterized protein I303_105990 [Kwoniella dejecticola CBS 10117]|uniref:RecQ-mediated genome instability protein 1 n=1 Tax=Kwoniella dejecticola CBS 10117 TaxID=1296121 RepID=A0A1A6A0Z7_9TREE|nr:uncharacterized protein I303_06010 [Kwoniella dejecticola CBS 10117]OBR83730.1 hypothetical protein I303_06010 [Kwoniella dejecticola CBS 10117]
MMDIQPIVSYLKRTYPVPEVDPAWVRECTQALIEAGQEATVDTVHTQFLYSDLAQSTLPSRTFPPGELHQKNLFPRPTILQIHHISEIGHSAFQIKHTMEQRSEVLSGQSLIRRMEDEDENAGEGEEIEEGKVPPYPRSMLKLELSDGRSIIRAMEYKRINELVLGQTSLGCKVVCTNVRCLRDTLLLTPQNTQVIESSIEHLEQVQKEEFMKDLNRRMGKSEDGPANVPAQGQRSIKPPPAVRPTPKASIKKSQISTVQHLPVPQIISNAEAGPSRSSHYFNPNPDPPIVKPKAIGASGVVSTSNSRKRQKANVVHDNDEEVDDVPEPISKSRKSRAAAQKATANVQQLYRDIPNDRLNSAEIDMIGLEDDEVQDQDEDEEEFDDDVDVDESFIRQIDEVEARASGSYTSRSAMDQSAPRQTPYDHSAVNYRHQHQKLVGSHDDDEDDEDDEDDDFMILNESMIRQIDHITSASSTAHQTHDRPSSTDSRGEGEGAGAGRVKGKGKGKPTSTSVRKRYVDPDEDINTDDKTQQGDEDSFQVDESFLKQLDEVEYLSNRKSQSQSQSKSKTSSSQSRALDLSKSKSKSNTFGTGSTSSSSSLQDSQKENVRPEIIEISD